MFMHLNYIFFQSGQSTIHPCWIDLLTVCAATVLCVALTNNGEKIRAGIAIEAVRFGNEEEKRWETILIANQFGNKTIWGKKMAADHKMPVCHRHQSFAECKNVLWNSCLLNLEMPNRTHGPKLGMREWDSGEPHRPTDEHWEELNLLTGLETFFLGP